MLCTAVSCVDKVSHQHAKQAYWRCSGAVVHQSICGRHQIMHGVYERLQAAIFRHLAALE